MKNPGQNPDSAEDGPRSPNFATNDESPVPSSVGDLQGDESRFR